MTADPAVQPQASHFPAPSLSFLLVVSVQENGAFPCLSAESWVLATLKGKYPAPSWKCELLGITALLP